MDTSHINEAWRPDVQRSEVNSATTTKEFLLTDDTFGKISRVVFLVINIPFELSRCK
jgi:hypothetical protein